MDELSGFERDAPLSLLWEYQHTLSEFDDAFGLAGVSRTFAAVVLALAREAITHGRCVSYSRRRAHYSNRPKIYRDGLYTFHKILSAVEQLDKLGLIEHDQAPPGRFGRQSTMRAKQELVRLALQFIAKGVQIRRPRTCLLLKDSQKSLIQYDRSRSSDAMERELSAFNEALLSIDLGPSMAARTLLVRIFNDGSFSQGGRFYAVGGGWQTLSKQDRRQLTINGDAVVEIEYSEIHPTLAYHKAGLPAPIGTYDIPGYPRGLVKIAFNIMLNCRTEHQARAALAAKSAMLNHLVGSEIFGKGNAKQLRVAAAAFDPTLNQLGLETAAAIIDELKQKHRSIEQMFFSGIGPQLQRMDSQIASLVMKDMCKIGEMPLSVHDSFIVRASQGDRLEQAMIEAGERMHTSLSCKRS